MSPKILVKYPVIAVAASISCKRMLYDFHDQTEAATCTDYPQTYLEFEKQQILGHQEIQNGDEVIEMFVPEIKGVLLCS